MLAKCELQTETLRGLVNTRTAGCCWTGMLFQRAGARDTAGLFADISGGASHDSGFQCVVCRVLRGSLVLLGALRKGAAGKPKPLSQA